MCIPWTYTPDLSHRKFAGNKHLAFGWVLITRKLPLTSVSGRIFTEYTAMLWFIYNIKMGLCGMVVLYFVVHGNVVATIPTLFVYFVCLYHPYIFLILKIVVFGIYFKYYVIKAQEERRSESSVPANSLPASVWVRALDDPGLPPVSTAGGRLPLLKKFLCLEKEEGKMV